jgi:hypothetical protein
MDSRAKQLIETGDNLFSKRMTLMSFWQEVADNFYPERADFTVSRTLGEDFAAQLNSSYPLLVRRELGNSISAMLRRQDQEWFQVSIDREDRLDYAGKKWLERATQIQRRAMYDRATQFVRATKEGDHDFVSFGQCVITKDINYANTALLYRCWHLRDVSWCESMDGTLSEIHHKLKPSVRWLMKEFGKEKLHRNVTKNAEKNPHGEIQCRRIIMSGEDYDGRKAPYVSLYIDVDNGHVIDERNLISQPYIIPRWQTVSGSQYAYSPAVVAGLPDARLLQAMTLTLLEAGEMAVRPPLIATKEAIYGGIKYFSGGITQVDAAYDERLGEALRPVIQDTRSLPFGMEISKDKMEMLAQAFYLNKLSALPPKEMTAYEASEWVKEYIRNAMPLFEPMEQDYNGALCESTFEDLMRLGAFGPARDIPQSIRGQQVQFKFESPLHDAIERQKGQKFGIAKQMIVEAADLDPSVTAMLDVRVALRDALAGVRIDTDWLRSEEDVEAHAQQVQQQQQLQQKAAMVSQAAQTGEQIGKAGKALQDIDVAA